MQIGLVNLGLTSRPEASGPPPVPVFLLMETADVILLESGSKIQLER